MVQYSNGALKRGTVYVTLNRMEAKGLIQSELEHGNPPGTVPRRVYEITALGDRTWRGWRLAEDLINSEGLTA